jgi:hypothetical protein
VETERITVLAEITNISRVSGLRWAQLVWCAPSSWSTFRGVLWVEFPLQPLALTEVLKRGSSFFVGGMYMWNSSGRDGPPAALREATIV